MGDMTPLDCVAVSQRASCLCTEQQVEAALDRMAVQISAQLAEQNPILMCVMHGGLIVTGKLSTRLDFPLQLDYLHATRYRGETSGSELHWRSYPTLDLAGRSVLIIDDIFDVGATLHSIVDYCRQQGAAKVYTAVLVDKQHDRKIPGLKPDFIGLQLPDSYLYGYGMDYKGYLRNAAGIYAIAEEDI
jgi:hypoxanthine phosphoribosyltransferase